MIEKAFHLLTSGGLIRSQKYALLLSDDGVKPGSCPLVHIVELELQFFGSVFLKNVIHIDKILIKNCIRNEHKVFVDQFHKAHELKGFLVHEFFEPCL